MRGCFSDGVGFISFLSGGHWGGIGFDGGGGGGGGGKKNGGGGGAPPPPPPPPPLTSPYVRNTCGKPWGEWLAGSILSR